jgi:serine phosphatase RsbU (regulator of sigma subunit)
MMSCGALAPGGRLLFLTDGVPEAVVGDGGPLGYERLESLLADGKAGSIDELFESVRAVSGPRLEDDWTALMLERRA